MNIGVWEVMNENVLDKIEKEISQSADWIGVVISPSTNLALNVELLETAFEKGIVGHPCIIRFSQDGNPTYALGQITTIQLRNPHIERHPIQKIISIRGEASPLTTQHDTRQIEIGITSVYSIRNNQITSTRMATVPPTGTRVYLLTQDILDVLMEPYKSEIFYVGKIYNTNIYLPMIFKHFGKSDDGRGLGEAYHIGVFGKTGSGKSFMARMLIVAYARHPEMSIVVIDPQGEFSKEIRENGTLRKILEEKLKRKVEVWSITRISLSNLETFKKLLMISGFLHSMGIKHPENQETTANLIVNCLTKTCRESARERTSTLIQNESSSETPISIGTAYHKDVFNKVLEYVSRPQNLQKIYSHRDLQQRVLTAIQTNYEELYELWKKITMLFATDIQNKLFLQKLIRKIAYEKVILFIDLSEQEAEEILWNEKVQRLVLNDIIDALKQVGSEKFKRGEQLNTLVVIDEAHRFAPRERQEEEEFELLRMNLVDAIRTTRKYGLGWMFISQTIASLHPELINQMRVYFFGYGLSWGSEFRTLKEIVGGSGNCLALYQSFKDPQSSTIPEEREYSFMVFGPVSPLSVSGAPLFITALRYDPENYDNEFVKANKLDIR